VVGDNRIEIVAMMTERGSIENVMRAKMGLFGLGIV
jgi:hypothetical protein